MQDPDAFDLGGFEFSASSHNAKEGGFTSKLATKTGTTISGVIYADGVVPWGRYKIDEWRDCG